MSFIPSVAFLGGSVGASEWVVLFVVVLIVCGPKRLPEIARKLGRTMEMFRRAADEFKDQLMNMDQDPPANTSQPAATTPSAADDTSVSPDASSDPYVNPYPDDSGYPGNEGQVENWSPETPTDEPSSEASPDAAAETDNKSAGSGE